MYGLRVDSVHNDVIRMTADLGRQCESSIIRLRIGYNNNYFLLLTAAKALQRKHNDDQENQSDEGDKENLNNTVIPMDQPQQKKIRKKRNIATVTQNVKTLNARLETNPMTDPFFARLNSVVGDTNSSKRLMQNIIPTDNSKLRIPQHTPFWKQGDQTFAAESNEPKSQLLQIAQVMKPSELNKFFIRQGLSSYVLSNSPLEEDKDTSVVSRFGDDDMNETVFHNSIHADLQFDINAEVEPVAHDHQVMMDFGDMNNEDFDDLNEMDQVAIQRCKGLKRQAVMIDDMQPVVAAELEYSYRPLDNIDRFWAGPSHWKFRSSRRTMMSIGMRFSMQPPVEGADQQKRPAKKRKVPTTYTLTLEDVFNVVEDAENIISNVTVKKRTQLSNQTISRKWDQKKLKLPQDHKLPHDILEKFLYMSSQRVKTNYDVTFTGDDDGSHAYNYDNEVDRNYCSRLDPTSDTETETNTDMGQMDINNEFDNPDMPPLPIGVDEIPDVFEGAPERIEKINIGFARRAKVVDMKQLKQCSWNLISRNMSAEPSGEVKFKKLLGDLPKFLNRQMAENMSMPLAFYAILHLCNDKGLGLNDVEKRLQDFNIENATSID